MDEYTNCSNCKNELESPVLLPCGDSVCQKHTIDLQEPFICQNTIPVGGFTLNKKLSGMIRLKFRSNYYSNRIDSKIEFKKTHSHIFILYRYIV